MNATAYHRKKQPDLVRQAVLDCASHMAAQEGLARVSIQAVAEAAGVTKGGVFHHFPNKKALVAAVFEQLIARLDQDIDAHLSVDAVQHGRFTRAYVRVTFTDHLRQQNEAWQALCMSMANDPDGQKMWAQWMQSRLNRHADTDSDPMLEVVRFAADGAWLALMAGLDQAVIKDVSALCERLLALTQPPQPSRMADEPPCLLNSSLRLR